MARYLDLRLDLAHAVNVAFAAQFRINAVLTLDRRDFRAVRPLSDHDAFRLRAAAALRIARPFSSAKAVVRFIAMDVCYRRHTCLRERPRCQLPSGGLGHGPARRRDWLTRKSLLPEGHVHGIGESEALTRSGPIDIVRAAVAVTRSGIRPRTWGRSLLSRPWHELLSKAAARY